VSSGIIFEKHTKVIFYSSLKNVPHSRLLKSFIFINNNICPLILVSIFSFSAYSLDLILHSPGHPYSHHPPRQLRQPPLIFRSPFLRFSLFVLSFSLDLFKFQLGSSDLVGTHFAILSIQLTPLFCWNLRYLLSLICFARCGLFSAINHSPPPNFRFFTGFGVIDFVKF